MPAPVPSTAPADEEPVEGSRTWRAVWVHLFDDTLKTERSIADLVATLEAAGVRQVIAQVARRHDAYYDSAVLPRTQDPALEPGLDVVAELVQRAHAADIEVHAWVAFAPTWHAAYDGLPAPDGWVSSTHGPEAPEAQRWVTRTQAGTWSEYLDPGVPAARAHYAAVLEELVERYDVDGIHLDYARYDGREAGYHPDAVAAYQLASGTTTTPAPDDAAWSAWRRDQTRALVTEVGEAVRAADPEVTLSAAVIAWGPGPSPESEGDGFRETPAYRDTFQDWPTWAREGLVDAVLPMLYFREHESEGAEAFDRWIGFAERVAAEVEPDVVGGIGGWLNTEAAVLTQTQAAVRRLDGAAVFSLQQPTSGDASVVWRRLVESSWMAEPVVVDEPTAAGTGS